MTGSSTLSIKIAPDGQPWATYVDACAKQCEATEQTYITDNEGVVGTLVAGPRLR